MKIPIKPRLFKRDIRRFRYIIIHDITCQFPGDFKFYKDSPITQTPLLRAYNFSKTDDTDLNYHIMVEKVGDDFESILCRPFTAMCEFDDIVSPYDISIHIGVMGSYDFENPSARFYKQLAYRAIAPFMATFRIPIGNVLMHNEVSSDQPCPGVFFSKDRMINSLKEMELKK